MNASAGTQKCEIEIDIDVVSDGYNTYRLTANRILFNYDDERFPLDISEYKKQRGKIQRAGECAEQFFYKIADVLFLGPEIRMCSNAFEVTAHDERWPVIQKLIIQHLKESYEFSEVTIKTGCAVCPLYG